MTRGAWLLWSVACVLVGVAAAEGRAGEVGPRRPNIVFILADDLGYGDVGYNGQERIHTPRIDGMVREGMRLTRFYAGSAVGAPSRCTFITGLHTGHALVRDTVEIEPEGQFPLPERTRTLPLLLRAAGYRSALVGKWGLGGPASSGVPTRQGFDSFFGYLCAREARNYYPTHLWRNEKRVDLDGNTLGNAAGAHYSHDLFADEALRFIRDNAQGAAAGTPFFLYVAFAIPHVSLQAPAEALAEYQGKMPDAAYDGRGGYVPQAVPHAAYAAMVTRLDRDVGRILDALKEAGIEGDTLVVFTSDNGPASGRVGGADSAFFNSTGGLRGLKGSLYEGGIRVPFVARWPGHIAPGTTSDEPAAMYDMMPTLLEVAGADAPTHVDGVSMAPTLLGNGGGRRAREFLYWEFPGYGGQVAIRIGKYKALCRNLVKRPETPFEVYDLEADERETRNIASEHPEIVARAHEIMRQEHVNSRNFAFGALDQ